MCSPTSHQLPSAPDAVDSIEAFSEAVVQVAEDSLFAFADPCSAEQFAEASAMLPADEGWLTATVRFHGPFLGQTAVALPHSLALELSAAFCGGSTDDLTEAQVHDFAGEVANMACGLWLTRTHGSERFDLDAPHVTTSVRAEAGPEAAARRYLLVNDVPVAMTLHRSESAG